ncbi:MAG TPA: endonuclease MutS2 [Clostridiaceae bacterium]|nr:endonuclease MutS2 [Clostridiaceae bacterium]
MDRKTVRILEFDKIIQKLADLTASELGRELVETLSPEKEFIKVEASLRETSDGVSFIVRKGSPPLGGIHNIKESIKRVELGSVLNPGELLKIADVLRAGRNLKNYAGEGVTIQDNIVSGLIGSIETNKRIEEKIYRAIVSEDEIADGASTALANIRRQIRNAQEAIKDKLNELIKSPKYQKYIQESIVTMRGDRYVIPVKQEYRSEFPGLVHDSSASGATIFIEPMAVVEANNHVKQLKIKEQIEIERILKELTSDVNGIIDSLKSNVSILARLDFIFAKAKLSVNYNCVCPELNEKGHIVIKKGRHPLIDPESVVPIDLWIGEEFRTLVVTGPNTGGKTVTLKTVGLFTLMAQAGLHIPANEGTKMSVFNKVFADIGDEQSIEQSLSTFSSHMTNIVKIIEKADNKSLVLFDELGAGTDPTEGAALAMAILEYLHDTGCITVATTHYSELKMYAISTQGVENASCEFDVQTLKPTYRLLIGVPGKSNAFAISKRLGLPKHILERAKEFLTGENIKFEDIIMSIEHERKEAEKEKELAKSYRAEIEKLRDEIERQNEKIRSQRDRIIKEAREEARRLLLDAKREIEEMMETMKKIQEEQELAARNKAAEEIKQKLRSKINQIEESLSETILPRQGYIKPPENLKPGDTVLIINLNQKGTVLEVPDKDGQVLVQAGIMKINVHVTNLKLVDEQVLEIHKNQSRNVDVTKSANISTELDLRGFNLDEAIASADKYLDDASISGLKEVTIIHGKGTGTLRSGIHQFLKSHPHVKTFRLGKFGEGEAGVTIVQLK